MSSNSGGPGPWGSGGPHSVPPGGDGPNEPGGPRPGGPWGPGGWRPGGRVPPPELDQIIARMQAAIRGIMGGRGPGGASGHRGLLLLGIGVIAIWLASGFYRVEPDEQGIVLRFGAFNRTTLPGLNYHLPWPVEIGRDAGRDPHQPHRDRLSLGAKSRTNPPAPPADEKIPAESLMLTGDENIIDIDLTVFWRIDNAVSYLFNTRDPDVTIKAVAESVLREVMGRTPIQPALGPMRAQIAGDVMDQSQRILNGYGAGVQITQVLLQKVDPPDAVIESFRDVQRANTDAERLRNEAQAYANDIVPRARGDAARVVASGQGEKQAAIAQATGDTKRFLSVLAAYRTAKDITLQRMYLDTMRDILTRAPAIILDDKVKGLLPYLQVDGASPPPLPGATAPAPGVPPPPPTAPGPQAARTTP